MTGLRLAIVLLGVSAAGCFGAIHAGMAQYSLEQALVRGDLPAARRSMDQALGASSAGGSPDRVRIRTGRFLLERGVLAMAEGDFVSARRDLTDGERVVDGDDVARWNFFTAGSGEAKGADWNWFRRGWVQGPNIPWGPKAYERLMISPFAALAHLASGNATGACVEGRRFGSTARYLEPFAADAAPTRELGHLVSAIACDAAADDAEACHHLERAAAVPRYDVMIDRTGLSARLSACRERREAGVGAPNLWLVVLHGRVPRPHSVGTGITAIVGGTRPETVALRIDDETTFVPEIADLVATARADYSVAVGLVHPTSPRPREMYRIEDTEPRHQRPGAWSNEAWTTLPGHAHLVGRRVAPGTREIEVTIGKKVVRRRVDVGESPRTVPIVLPGGVDEDTPEELSLPLRRALASAQ